MAAFYLLLLQNLPIYIALFMLVFLGLYLAFRKYVFSIFDPFFYFLIVTEGFCISDVVFMGLYDLIEVRHLVQYLSSELALFVGIWLFRPPRKAIQQTPSERDFQTLRVMFGLSMFLFVVLNLVVYATRGVPLLLDNRMAVYQEGAGLGFISRILDVLLIVIFYYLLEVHRRRGWRWLEFVCVFVVAVIQVLSGAKSSILTLVFIAALYIFMSGGAGEANRQLTRLLRRMFLLAIGGFLLIAQVQIADIEIGGRTLSLFDQAALRFVNNGDAFLYAYPSNTVDTLDSRGPVQAVLREYLAFLRIAGPDEMQMHIGLQLSKAFSGADAITQTNAKHNLFGYVNFGPLGGVLYSFALGLVIGFMRQVIYKKRGSSWMAGIPYIILNLGFLSAGSDLDNSSRAVLNVVFVFYPLVFVAYCLANGAGNASVRRTSS